MNISHGHYSAALYRLPLHTRLAAWWRRLPEWQQQALFSLALLAFYAIVALLIMLVDWLVS